MQPHLFDINSIVLILGGILATSAIIVAQRPDTKKLIDTLTPFQTVIGVALMVMGIINGVWLIPQITNFFKVNLLSAAVSLTVCGASIVLGALFGAAQIAQFIPGKTLHQNMGAELAQKVAPYQVLLGLVGVVASIAYFLYRFHILTMSA
jgi:hypothetical protein